MSDLAKLIETSLSESGQSSQAVAFRRWLGRWLTVDMESHNVRDVKKNLSGMLGRVRENGAVTISPHSRLNDAVIVISLSHLASGLGELAAQLELHPGADSRDPMTMFARVDELGDAGDEPLEVDVWRPVRPHPIDL